MKDLENLPKLRIKGVIMPNDSGDEFGKTFSSQDVINFLEANEDEPEIVVEIESTGGSVSEGKLIYTRLKSSGKKITTITFEAYSIATLLMLVGQRRLITENADFGIHQARVFPEDLPTGPLLSEDLFRLGSEVEQSSGEILNIYCNVLGEDKRHALIATMAQDAKGGARQAIKLGFATGYYDKVLPKKVDAKSITITAYAQQLIKNNMAADNKDLLKTIEDKMLNGFKSLARMLVKTRNEMTLTSGGKQIYVVPSDPAFPDELMNAKVFEIDEAGIPTEIALADGEHPLDDGRTIVVANGVVTEVRDPIDAKKLQEENAALAAEKVALTEKLAALEVSHAQEVVALKTEMKKEFDGIQMAFTEFKKAVPGLPKKEEALPIDTNKKLTINDIRLKMEEDKKLNIV